MADKAVKEAEEIKEETPETEEVLQENEAEAGTETSDAEEQTDAAEETEKEEAIEESEDKKKEGGKFFKKNAVCVNHHIRCIITICHDNIKGKAAAVFYRISRYSIYGKFALSIGHRYPIYKPGEFCFKL